MGSLPTNKQKQHLTIGDTMNLFKDLKQKEVHCAARAVNESTKYITQHNRLGVCVFKATGLPAFCYATGTCTIDSNNTNGSKQIEVRCARDESIKVFVDEFYPLNYFDSPKVIFRLGDLKTIKIGRVLGFDFENQECVIYEEEGESSNTYKVPVSDVCLVSNIGGWGE